MGICSRSSFFLLATAWTCLTGLVHAQTPCVDFDRVVDTCAMPDGEVLVTVTLTSTCGDSLTAVGLRETLPDGWTFGGVAESSEDPPALVSSIGTEDSAEFAWLDVPEFPATFSYTLQVPASETASRTLTGVPVFRENAGEVTGTLVATTVCFESMGGEGEGEGEGEVDPSVPRITLVGEAEVLLECGMEYVELGAIASDREDGDLTGSIVLSGFVDTQSAGSYVVTYNVNDSDGNQAPQIARTIIVTDTVAPTIMLTGDDFITQACGSPYVELGAVAIDACDGALSITVTGEVDVQEPGTYMLIYSARDSAGLNASVTRSVTVQDMNGPLITLNGDSPMMVECNTPYEEPGAIAVDACDGMEAAVTIENNTIDTSVEGTHTVRYRATDSNGFQSAITRQVMVVDTTPPVITLLGDNPLVLDCGSIFVDPNAMAMDACEGEVTVSSDALSLVDTEEANTVEVTYSAIDSNGNRAFASRTVIVSGPTCEGGASFCGLAEFGITQPAATDGMATVLIPEGAQSRRILFSAAAAFSSLPGCSEGTLQVTYDVDGSVQTSQAEDDGFPVTYFLGEGQHEILATAEVMENGNTLTESFTLNVASAADADTNGIVDAPFSDLRAEGESWTTDTEASGTEGTTTMTTWFGPCGDAAGDPLVVRVRNPENNSQVLTVEIDRGLLACDAQGIVTVALGDRLENILGAGAAQVPAPPEGAASGTPFFDISIVTSSDGGATFAPLSPAALAERPVRFTLSGLTIMDAASAGVVHFPTDATPDGNGSFSLTPGTGDWADVPAANVTVEAGRITGETTSLSLFAARITADTPAKEGGPSCAPSNRGGSSQVTDLLFMAAVLLLLVAVGRRPVKN